MSDLEGLSKQQRDIVDLPLDPISVTACAGSGKTMTAVHRVAEIRKKLVDPHGLIALLSFSNVAVDTFRRDYTALVRSGGTSGGLGRIEIDTVDGFITGNILRPHAHLVMNCERVPFLVSGAEPFTRSFTVFDGTRPNPTTLLQARYNGKTFSFGVATKQGTKAVDPGAAKAALAKFGQVGAYTHNHGRYWAIRTLAEVPMVLKAMARRYPQILIDEAQDIGPEQQVILELLMHAGSKVSLIGDANQGIYEFDNADGSFLRQYSKKTGVTPKELQTNFRSVPALVTLANKLTDRDDGAARKAPDCMNGAYYFYYKASEKEKALDTFRQLLANAEVDAKDAVVLCRSADWVADWSGEGGGQGQGVVRHFVDAVVARDQLNRPETAYNCLCRGIVGLLADEHEDLCARLMAVGRIEERKLRQAIFAFLRDEANGLPSGKLVANGDWHEEMSSRVKAFIPKLCAEYGLKAATTIGQRLANKDLDASPLVPIRDLAQADATPLRFSTVHRVKGESIGGVMYVVSKQNLKALLEGPSSELGRIGYVALTRARNLFVLAVPDNCQKEFEEALVGLGFRKPGSGGAITAVKVVAGDGSGASGGTGEGIRLGSVLD